MHTFPATTPGLSIQKAASQTDQKSIIAGLPGGPVQRWLRRWGRCIAAAVLLTSLVGCSAIRLAYSQAPTLAFWWIDDFVDLNDAQSTALRRDIDSFFAWHRAEELPRYTERLKQWQTMATRDTTADQSCQQYEVLKAAYLRSVERSIEPLTRLALSLQPDQLQHLARHHAKSNEKFIDEWLDDGPEARRNRLLEKALDRYEMLYGDLTPAQRNALQVRVKASSFDPQRVLNERKRRQGDLLATLKQAQSQPAQAASLLRQWHERVLNSPDAAYASYARALIREGCEQYAALHNSTSPAQREIALKRLKDHESDLLAMAPSL